MGRLRERMPSNFHNCKIGEATASLVRTVQVGGFDWKENGKEPGHVWVLLNLV